MNPTKTLERLDNLIQAHSILRHPFYVAWRRGVLTRAQLATYAGVYYPHVEAFPGYLEAALACTNDPVIRAGLERNLDDERGVPGPHPELWLDFAEELGLNRRHVASAAPHPAAAATVSVFNGLAGRHIASALAALYSYESQQPEVSRQKADGLRSHYGVQNSKGLHYFDVHATADIDHRAHERDGLARCISGDVSELVLQSGQAALGAYWNLLDGVCEAAGISTADCGGSDSPDR